MKKIPVLILTILLVFNCGLVWGQLLIQNTGGNPVIVKRYVEGKTSPYFFNDWQTGTVKLGNGEYYVDVELVYDVVNSRLFFRKEGVAMEFDSPVSEFTIGDALFRSGYTADKGGNTDVFYQVLSDGKAQLLKHITKSVSREMPYGGDAMALNFVSKETYFIAHNGELKKLRKDKRAVMEALKDKLAEMRMFVSTYQTDFKSDADIASLLDFYNSL